MARWPVFLTAGVVIGLLLDNCLPLDGFATEDRSTTLLTESTPTIDPHAESHSGHELLLELQAEATEPGAARAEEDASSDLESSAKGPFQVASTSSSLVRPDLPLDREHALESVVPRPEPFRLMSAEKERQLRKALPRVSDRRIARILEDPALILYTDAEIPKAYQFWDNSLQGIHAASYNISANRSEPHGNGNIEFPWGTPAGTHRTENVSSFRFLWLPFDDAGQRLPVVWFRQRSKYDSSLGYVWRFPVGTIFGEVLQQKGPDGRKYTFELRVRIREKSEWHVDVFRPFPRVEDLQLAVEERRPQWYEDENLVAFMLHLMDRPELKELVLEDSHPTKTFSQKMGVDVLPEVADEDLIRELLTGTKFRSALGSVWREGINGAVACAPTTEAAFHIVPAHYDAGFIEVDRISCMRCHKTVNQNVARFEPGRDWYGRVRGSDGIFSFHPFDLSCISDNGFSRKVKMREQFVAGGILEEYDPEKHSDEIYTTVIEQ